MSKPTEATRSRRVAPEPFEGLIGGTEPPPNPTESPEQTYVQDPAIRDAVRAGHDYARAFPEPQHDWVTIRPLGRNVLPGDVLHFGQVLTIEADPSRNTILCQHVVDGERVFTNIAGDRRVDTKRPIPLQPS